MRCGYYIELNYSSFFFSLIPILLKVVGTQIMEFSLLALLTKVCDLTIKERW